MAGWTVQQDAIPADLDRRDLLLDGSQIAGASVSPMQTAAVRVTVRGFP